MDSYELENDWEYVDGVEDAVFIFGSDRETTLVPGDSCKVLVANPKPSGSDFRVVDLMITVWAETLLDSQGVKIEPDENDQLKVGNINYVILRAAPAMMGSQWVCSCRRKPSTGSRN